MIIRKQAFGTTEIARICHVTPPTVGRWIEEGKLPCFTTGGGHRRVWDADLARFLREHNMPVPPGVEPSGAVRILIVDDEPQARRLLRRVLSQLQPSAEIHEAEDGFEAGRQVASLVPALVVLDFKLPGVDGVKVCRAIRADGRLKAVRVLAVSGYDVEETRRECLEAGADDFLGKPFEVRELQDRLARLLPEMSMEPR